MRKIVQYLITATLLAAGSLGIAQAQTVSVNGSNCPNATVTFGAGAISISTGGCGTTQAPVAPTITSAAPPTSASLNVAYPSFHTFTASGTAPITWTVSSGALPTGMTLSTGGLLSGTPTATGTFTFAVTAANGTNPNAVSSTYTIDVTNAPAITSAAPASATINVAYTHNFSASQAITTWSTTGTLPPGLIFGTSGANGQLSGTPTMTGSFPFTVSAMNANGTATQNVTLVVNPAATAPTITSAAPPAGQVGTAYSFQFTASGTNPITWNVASGSLPAGLNLSSAGLLSGMPTTAGMSTFAVRASNGTLPDAVSSSYSVTINNLPAGQLAAIDGTPIPFPQSKFARLAGAVHAGPMGGGNYPNLPVNAYSVALSRCTGTPAITTYWHHNIDLLDYGYQSASDYLDFPPNQAITYQFTGPAPVAGFSPRGRIFLIQSPVATPTATFVSVSRTPCDFDVSKANVDACYRSAPSDNNLDFELTTGGAVAANNCRIDAGQVYYLNVRWLNAASPSVDACAASGNSNCGSLLQIKKF
jgi:hypothetical protein